MTKGEDKADQVATHVEERPMISRFCFVCVIYNLMKWRQGGGESSGLVARLAAYSRERKRG